MQIQKSEPLLLLLDKNFIEYEVLGKYVILSNRAYKQLIKILQNKKGYAKPKPKPDTTRPIAKYSNTDFEARLTSND